MDYWRCRTSCVVVTYETSRKWLDIEQSADRGGLAGGITADTNYWFKALNRHIMEHAPERLLALMEQRCTEHSMAWQKLQDNYDALLQAAEQLHGVANWSELKGLQAMIKAF